MDKRAAELYLNILYGTREGYVAVAYKDKGQSWQERQFSWPADKSKLVGWASVHEDANIFICPALRQDGHTRKKGDMLPTQWLWADVDWQAVPADKVADVKARITELGTLTVSSGSGNNMHVYVKLDRAVEHERFIKLNTGLRDYLYADNKQADNSFLRLPGTTNWKTDAGSVVKVIDQRNTVHTTAALMKRRAFRDAKVSVEDVDFDWTLVDVSGVTGKARRMARMPVDEALGRFGGKRYQAVRGVVRELHKQGLTGDQIHTLMDRFPAGLDKMAEENGYHLHEDIARCLATIERNQVIEEVTADLDEQIEVFQEVSSEEADAEDRKTKIRELRRSWEIRRAAEMEEAADGYARPPDHTTVWLSDALNTPPEPVQWLIEGMCSADATVVIAGQYKTGKTKLMIASLISSLVDGDPFLGTYSVHVPEGGAKVGHWNLEMSPIDLIDKYMRPVGYKNPGNIKIANWRGQPGNILSDPGMADAVAWLTGLDVWTIDSWTALCRMCGVDPNSGKEVGQLLDRIEHIKVQSGVRVCFFLAHTARSSSESDKPGTRGASELDDHVDSRWMLTVDRADTRFIQAEGRDTPVSPISLDFDEATGRSVIGSITRQSAAEYGWVQGIVAILKSMKGKGLNQTELTRRMKEIKPVGVAKAKEYIQEAVDAGFIEVREEGRVNGGKDSKMHYLVSDVAPSGDRTRNATPSEVDLTDIHLRPRKKL